MGGKLVLDSHNPGSFHVAVPPHPEAWELSPLPSPSSLLIFDQLMPMTQVGQTDTKACRELCGVK